jgi:bacterioferritin
MVQKASAALTDMLQQAIAREIQVSVQYMWQHIMAKGLEADAAAEEEALDLYKKIIKQAASEGDSTTRLLFEQVLADEEAHHDTFTTLLGK